MIDYSKQVHPKMKRQLLEWVQHDHNFNYQKTETILGRTGKKSRLIQLKASQLKV